MTSEHNFQRVRWHSRRGLLELDLVLVPFADQYFQTLSAADQDAYVKLLTMEDQDLLAWMLGHAKPAESDIAHIINLIRSRRG
ncbi:MAG: succinate dehydrogenase assembly factor 2 [Pseudomonadales bacterium]